MSVSWPDAGELAELFRDCVAGDPLAVNDFVLAVLEPLAAYLRRRHRADEHDCNSAAADAVLDLVRRPSIYDPARGTLIGFLCMAAERDFLNLCDKERKHHAGRKSSEYVELAPDDGNSPASEYADDLPSFDDPQLAGELAAFDAVERAVFDLMRNGERATAAFAAALGVAHLPEAEQAREAKRVKDRIKQRLRRAVGGKA